ncbi:unnamed protein product [Thlaspi arvense]|uniref:TIR domain-containing protein n=1 Tax=Thlaspi arvense TaxID=13288 RepID=A0AAU9T2X7_THLAR|nr:unnamed protein product [Thlaspi arvense]
MSGGRNGFAVVPVFYGLTKSELRKQCLKLNKMYPDDRVTEWRQALLEIADLPGHASSLELSDSELVEEIVADVRQKLDLTGKIGEKGVYGLLEEHLGKKLGITSGITRGKIRHKKILLVLDNVCKPLGATKFLRGFDWFGAGSLIIITSRDKQVLVQCRVNEIYEVQGLNEHEALQLFSRCAFGKDKPDQNLLSKLSKDLVDYANGNPLALSICSRELECKARLGMESTVLKLKQHLSEKFFDVFKSSYDSLSDSEKEIFLHIAFFFRGEKVEDVVQSLAGCGFFPRIGIDVLVDKSLVTVSGKRLPTHNLIIDTSLKIIRDQTEENGVGYGFFDASNIQSLIQDYEIGENGAPKATPELGNDENKAIILDTSNLAFKGHIAFQHMYDLRYLKIYNSHRTKDTKFGLHEDAQSLPPELRLLHWENYPSRSFPQDLDVQYLVELNMPYSKLEKLWGGTKSLEVLKRITLSHSLQLVNVDELQHSRNIEKIDLRGCLGLQGFPDMRQSKHLRVVKLSIRSFPKVPPSIRKLHLQGILNHSSENLQELTNEVNSFSSQDLGKLVSFQLKDCPHLRSLPDMITLESLQVLDLSGCSELEETQGFPRNLKELSLAKTDIREITCHHLSELVILNMEDCKRLRHLPIGMGSMKSLATLKLSGCSELEDIQDLPRNLRELYLARTAVKAFPPSLLKNLSKLVVLCLEHCKRLKHLQMGGAVSNMISLVTLNLSGCSELEDIDGFPQNLKELYLGGTAIRELSSSIGDLADLARLDLKNCEKLRHLPEGMQNLNLLEFLDLSDCSELKVGINLPKAKELRLYRMDMPVPATMDMPVPARRDMPVPATENEADERSDERRGNTRQLARYRSVYRRFVEKYLRPMF